VLDWIRQHGDAAGLDASRVALAGDSSGATIAIGAAIRARDRGDAPVRFLMLAYPALDPSLSTGSYREFADDDFLSRAEMEWYWAQYLGPDGDPADPLAAPVNQADLSRLPPTLLTVAENDVLRDEGESFGERLRAAGVPVTVGRYEDMPHGFLVMTLYLEGARGALREAGHALAAALAAPGGEPT
jgi:acetyl esterase